MHHPSNRKYLLLALLAAAVLVFDAFVGHSQPGPNRQTEANRRAIPAVDSEPAKEINQIAALSSRPTTTEALISVDQTPATPAASEPELTEKLSRQLQTIENDYKSMEQPIYEKSEPVISPEDRTKLAYLDKEKLNDISQVLSPAELEIYQNRADESAAPKRR